MAVFGRKLAIAALAVAAGLPAPSWRAAARPKAAAPQPALVPGSLAPGFTPPAAGTYHLEHILRVPDGRVLDSDGSAHSLRGITTGRITLFSLVYAYCTDAKGCPLAYAALHALRVMLAGDLLLRGQVRLVSMSFDPEFDTPAMMRNYGGDDAVPSTVTPWHFLTTASPPYSPASARTYRYWPGAGRANGRRWSATC